ncbi:hypothetical protein YYC_03328 [Plasmodium yoelii 17X]|uniref:YIR protein n=1 Tax=Plasmodium yoelii 17X TaxID=1323249 RepID=V7PHL1_PLAYE|nr:hypothetical protein YYC_03328 [Plasmodium yoelii 17X]
MNKEVCKRFENVWKDFPDTLSNEKYQFKGGEFLNKYCTGNSCDGDLDMISAGCLYLLNEFFKNSSVFRSVAKNNINIVEYIMIWLSYMLNLKKNEGSESLNYFYTTSIDNDKYKTSIDKVGDCNNYKDLIDKKKYFLDIDKNIISNLYDAFKSLCKMYTGFDESTSNCTNCSQHAQNFAEKYKELNKESNIPNNRSYNKLVYTLSNDYNNLKINCKNCSSFPEIEPSIYALTSEDTSSSSIGNKLISVLSILVAIAFLGGISYKYSLFGFRKRFKKQQIKEKMKNIKKRINN